MRPTRLVDVIQHETARINCEKMPDVNIVLTDIQHCVAVVFKDKAGNISATHVDAITDLKFIGTEAKQMQGNFTVDIIKNSQTPGKLAEKVSAHVKEFIQVESVIQTTKTGIIWVSKEKIHDPDHVYMNVLMDAGKIYTDEGGRYGEQRFWERAFTTMLDPQVTCPVVVYDHQWTGKYTELSSKAKLAIDQARMMTDLTEQTNFLRETAKKALADRYENNSSVRDALEATLGFVQPYFERYYSKKTIPVHLTIVGGKDAPHAPLGAAGKIVDNKNQTVTPQKKLS